MRDHIPSLPRPRRHPPCWWSLIALRALLPILAAGVAWTSVGCGGRPARFEKPLDVSGPAVVGRYIVYLDHTRARVTVIEPLAPVGSRVRHVAVGQNPAFFAATPDRQAVLVLCRGLLATRREDVDEAPTLHRVDLGAGTTEVFDLGSPFDRITVSPDGRFAVAFYGAGEDPGAGEVWRNPNAVALLDLASRGAPVEKTVRSFGDVPLGVVFSPPEMAPIRADGTLAGPRTLAVVFADGYLTFLDAERPERREVTVRLTLPGTDDPVIPDEIVFAPNAGAAFVRATGTNDVYALTFSSRTAPDPAQHDFVISINTLAAGQAPADVAVFSDGGARKILVANRLSEDITVIDAATSQFVTIPIGDPIDRIITYPATDPDRAVLFSRAAAGRRLYFLDLADVEAARGQNLTVLVADQGIVDIDPVPGGVQAIVVHDNARTALSVLHLEDGTLSPMRSHAQVAQYAFAGGGALLVGFSAGRDQLGLIDLDNLASRTLQLSDAPLGVLALAPPSGDPQGPVSAVVVDHGLPSGLLTVVPAADAPERQTTYQLSGFLLEGLFAERP